MNEERALLFLKDLKAGKARITHTTKPLVDILIRMGYITVTDGNFIFNEVTDG